MSIDSLSARSLRRLLTHATVIALSCFAQSANADTSDVIQGFSEPFRMIQVATPETGIIKSIEVEEGTQVTEGQVVSKLDSEIHQALLKIAQMSMKAQGRINSASAELSMRSNRLLILERLVEQGHARQEEVDRARADVAISEGSLLDAREGRQLKELEFAKIQQQLNRRTIFAPASGVVSNVNKNVGEFIAPNDPVVLTIVQLNPLKASFQVPTKKARELKAKQKVKIVFDHEEATAEGTIHFIAPSAKSGMLEVKVYIDNSSGKFHSGEHCVLNL
jgi:RND family efflux transporter MFP subunit